MAGKCCVRECWRQTAGKEDGPGCDVCGSHLCDEHATTLQQCSRSNCKTLVCESCVTEGRFESRDYLSDTCTCSCGAVICHDCSRIRTPLRKLGKQQWVFECDECKRKREQPLEQSFGALSVAGKAV